MFQLQDGRTELWQWDINRAVRVSDPTVSEVHFCNKTDNCSLVVKVYANPTDSELYADIPNILLQSDFPIRVYAYCGEGYTKVEKVFKVHSRTKPSDYVYTETEVITVQAIEKRMGELEDSLSANIDKTVSDYLKENPPQVDLTGYATEEWVEGKGYLTEHQDISGKADREHTHSYNSLTDKPTIPSIDGLATEEYVDNAVRNSTEGIATENWVKNQGYISSIPSEYVTENELSAKGYATNSQLSAYAKKSELPTVPTKVSELENDKGYLTEHQSLEGYATESYVDNAVKNVEVDLTGYATEKYVDDAIANIDIPEGGGGDADLSNYYTKEETDTAIYNSKDSYYIRLSNIPTGEENAITASEELVEFATRFVNDKNVCLHFQETDGTTNTGYKSANITYLTNRITFKDATIDITKIAQNGLTHYFNYTLKLSGTDWVIYKTFIGGFTLTTKEYVDGLFANIATAEGGSY